MNIEPVKQIARTSAEAAVQYAPAALAVARDVVFSAVVLTGTLVIVNSTLRMAEDTLHEIHKRTVPTIRGWFARSPSKASAEPTAANGSQPSLAA